MEGKNSCKKEGNIMYQNTFGNNLYNNFIPQQYRMIEQQPQTFSLKGRPVASVEEARASMIDLDGSIFYFPSMSNNYIYTKQINLDGTSSLKTYQLVETPPPFPQTNEFVTKEEFNSTINKILEQMKGANTDDEPGRNEPTAFPSAF